jgi:thiol-disulfide isomerase/thioredoxin
MRARELQGRAWIGTGGRTLTLADLRGKVVVLDFWTLCCINCLHVLDELRPLEAKYADNLVVIGVHSPKFAHEADPDALRAATIRYDISHPVLDDPTLSTWRAYRIDAWPTLVFIDPEGFVAMRMAGEGHGAAADAIVAALIADAKANGTLRSGNGPYVPLPPTPGMLAFPSKAIPLDDAGTHLLVADTRHHSLAELDGVGDLVRRIGKGQRGLVDGPPGIARFAEPSGLTRLPEALADEVEYDIVVADTVNHALRGVRLGDGEVSTLAGTGAPWMPGDPNPWFVPGAAADADPRHVPLSSPWDVAWDGGRRAVVIAMAGIHQLWAFDPVTGNLGAIAGTRAEGRVDGPADEAWLAQPSGLAVDGNRVWFVDSETSSLRVLEPPESWGGTARLAGGEGPAEPTEGGRDGDPERWRGDGEDAVRTVIGQGLFDFGLVDGPVGTALMQHPLGLAVEPGGRSVLVADTYNGALRRYDFATGELTTLATGLSEPSDVVILAADDGPGPGAGRAGWPRVLAVESAAHRITEIPMGEPLDVAPARAATNRPPLDLQEGVVRLTVPFVPVPGQKLDPRFGPSVELTVSATPPELLTVGAGTTPELERALVVASGRGVLHVTARAASCDIDTENPACHVAAQEWGVPLRVVPRSATVADPADQEIELTLRG